MNTLIPSITKAAILTQVGEPLTIEDLKIPTLKAGQVLVKLAYSGVCGSQLNEVRGMKGEDKFLPHTLGHEGSGTVIAVGDNKSKVKKGENVVLSWIKTNGRNIPSTEYKREDGSIINSGAVSTFCTYAVVSENRIVKIPSNMPLKEAALLGCAIPTGAGMVLNSVNFSAGSSIAIFGIGGIGSSAILMAKMADAQVIIAIDIYPDKLKTALKMGATHSINIKDGNVLDRIMEISGGKGVDYAIEAAGRKDVMELAFESVHSDGGTCIIAGNLPQGEKISIDPFQLINGKRLIGTWGGESNLERDIPFYIKKYLSRKLDLGALINKEYSLVNINDAFNDLDSGVIGRPLIKNN